MKSNHHNELDTIIISQIQLILAEKRTSLAFLRTGIAVFALPLSVLSALIATSKYYDLTRVIHFLIPVLTLCTLLIILGFYLLIRSIIRIRNYDRIIREMKQKHKTLSEFIV